MSANEYVTAERALRYLALADKIPHRTEGERVMLELMPAGATRILDLGCGDGRLLKLVLIERPTAKGIAVDFSPTMLEKARATFAGNSNIEVVSHDLDDPLPDWGSFDVVVSGFAIHHCTHERKRSLYREIFARLSSGGVFCNLEHVASPTAELHAAFFAAVGVPLKDEDAANKLLDVQTQVGWLSDLGFRNADCFWKWRELALIAGWKP